MKVARGRATPIVPVAPNLSGGGAVAQLGGEQSGLALDFLTDTSAVRT